MKDQHMKKQLFVSLALAGVFVLPTLTRAQFADSVISYTEGSGVASGYNDPTAALGAPSQVTPGEYGGPVDPFDPPYLSSQIVGIGNGGSLTLQFNTPIQNNPNNPFGLDFIIFGHAGFNITNGDYSGGGITDGTLFTGGTSDVRVSVSADGTTFYTLNPTLTPQVDGLFPTDGSGNPFLPVNPALTAADFAGQDLAGIRALYNGSAGGAGFSLAWAIDSEGQSVSLSSIDYIRLDVLNDGTPAYIDAISAVPEPATLALAAAGAGFFFLRRRA
jgi:PEP-CTERM motif